MTLGDAGVRLSRVSIWMTWTSGTKEGSLLVHFRDSLPVLFNVLIVLIFHCFRDTIGQLGESIVNEATCNIAIRSVLLGISLLQDAWPNFMFAWSLYK